jgi:hypothetical protein
VNDLDVLVLCDWLKLNKSCDKLDLSGNLLAANAVRALGFMLHVNTALTELDLRRNPCCKADWSLGPPQLEALYLSYSVMAAGLDLNRTLRLLHVRSVPIPCHLLREPGAVVDLSAAYCASQRRPPISVRTLPPRRPLHLESSCEEPSDGGSREAWVKGSPGLG